MEKINNGNDDFAIMWLVIFLAITAAVFMTFIIIPAKAAMFVYGTNYNYSEVVLENNSYVHQGENISQGNYYDLSGVYGFSGRLAYWNDEYDAGYTAPDIIYTLDHPKKVYIDSWDFPVGKWWQWDGLQCKGDSDDCSYGFGHGNPYAFYVVKPLAEVEPTPSITTVLRNITVYSNGTSFEVPVTMTITIPATQTTPDIGKSNLTTLTVPTTIPTKPTPDPRKTPEIVTPKAPVSLLISLIAIAGVITFRRK